MARGAVAVKVYLIEMLLPRTEGEPGWDLENAVLIRLLWNSELILFLYQCLSLLTS